MSSGGEDHRTYPYGAAGYGYSGWAPQAQAYGMMPAGFGYGGMPMAAFDHYYGAYAEAYAAAWAGAQPQAMASVSESSAAPRGGAAGLLEELKEKQAIRNEHKQLQEQLLECDKLDYGRRAALQQKLSSVELRLRQMGEAAGDAAESHLSYLREERAKFRAPDDGSTDQFGRLCHVLTALLQTCEENTCLLSKAAEDRRVHQEWSDLIRSGLVGRSTKLKHVLMERPRQFELIADADGQPYVKFPEKSCTMQSAVVGIADNRQGALRADQVSALEAYMKKAGGSERVPRLKSLFGVEESQLRCHFSVYEDGGRLYATPRISSSVCAPTAPAVATSDELKGLERHLQQLTPSRASIADAMRFCLSSAAAAPLARGLVRALEEPDLETEAAVARLYLVSDVLYNSASSAKGAMRFRASFEELLPDAFERLGRQWLRCLKKGRPEWRRGEAAMRKVLAAWSEWSVFPPMYVRGLEALAFAPVGEVGLPEMEEDLELRRKLSRWCSPMHAARLPYAARMRGVSGSSLATAACRARLCHYERYWHVPGEVPAPEDVWEEDAPLARLPSDDADAAPFDAGGDDIDGEPLGEEELQLCAQMAGDDHCSPAGAGQVPLLLLAEPAERYE